MSSIHAALGDLHHELSTTRRVLERVTDEHLDWKPHPKSMSLGGLASHLANVPGWAGMILGGTEFDVSTRGAAGSDVAATRDEILGRFDENAASFRSALDAATPESLRETWTLRNGEQTVFQLPRIAVLRNMGINHMVHHRAQLGVYLRLLDIPVPSMYGPSADEG
ncbi:MAG TPA: DinB family protein [Longimicrobium sp.]|nr:DinB family protein [Longimicrobium sp.]